MVPVVNGLLLALLRLFSFYSTSQCLPQFVNNYSSLLIKDQPTVHGYLMRCNVPEKSYFLLWLKLEQL